MAECFILNKGKSSGSEENNNSNGVLMAPYIYSPILPSEILITTKEEGDNIE